RAARLADQEQLFSHRAFSLCRGRCNRLRSPWRHSILVSENERTHALRDAREMDFLANGCRLQHDVYHSAFSWSAWHAATRVHLSRPAALGWVNLPSAPRVFFLRRAPLNSVWNLATSFFPGKVAGDNPWDAWTLQWATTS